MVPLVITSYSIHYTKLYEYHGKLGKSVPLNPFKDSATIHSQNLERIIQYNDLNDREYRITSYNVCYTKLLRNKGGNW